MHTRERVNISFKHDANQNQNTYFSRVNGAELCALSHKTVLKKLSLLMRPNQHPNSSEVRLQCDKKALQIQLSRAGL